MVRLIAAFLLLITGVSAQPVSGTPGTFDYYLLTLSWSPEFCHSHAANTECAVGKHYGFIVHGLWPQFTSGKYPEHCSTAPGPSDTSFLKDIMPDPSLIAHEWSTHGTCTGLSASAYFNLIATVYRSFKIPALNTTGHPVSLAPSAIKQSFLGANPKIRSAGIAVNCPQNFLSAVQICVDKSGSPIVCPANAVRDCRARSISVPPVP